MPSFVSRYDIDKNDKVAARMYIALCHGSLCHGMNVCYDIANIQI